TGAGFGAADNVSAAEDDRNRLSLNRCRFVISERLASAQLRRRKSQLRKIHRVLLLGRQIRRRDVLQVTGQPFVSAMINALAEDRGGHKGTAYCSTAGWFVTSAVRGCRRH